MWYTVKTPKLPFSILWIRKGSMAWRISQQWFNHVPIKTSMAKMDGAPSRVRMNRWLKKVV